MALLIAIAVFVVLVLVVPLVRLWRRTGVFGMKGEGLGLPLAFVPALAWGVGVWKLEPQQLGIVAVPTAVHAVGWAFIAVGLALLVLAQAQMGASWRIGIDEKPTGLVTHGVYRLVRNPIYSAMSGVMLGAALVTPAAATVSAWAVVTLGLAVQARREERHLRAQHGDEFMRWARNVGRFVPRIGCLG